MHILNLILYDCIKLEPFALLYNKLFLKFRSASPIIMSAW